MCSMMLVSIKSVTKSHCSFVSQSSSTDCGDSYCQSFIVDHNDLFKIREKFREKRKCTERDGDGGRGEERESEREVRSVSVSQTR